MCDAQSGATSGWYLEKSQYLFHCLNPTKNLEEGKAKGKAELTGIHVQFLPDQRFTSDIQTHKAVIIEYFF